ncbi:hypothetical protein QJS66_23025 [Kocuria rhizophila]|nr:hypothetical protein QJS66_23025 [Kocuria rhizophila]
MVQQHSPTTSTSHGHGRPWTWTAPTAVNPAPYQGAEGEGFASGNSDSTSCQAELIRRRTRTSCSCSPRTTSTPSTSAARLHTHLTRRADLTMVTTEVSEDPSRYSVVETSESGEVTGLRVQAEQPRSNLVAGEMFLVLHGRSPGTPGPPPGHLGELGDDGEDPPHVLQHHTVVEHRHLGYWMDLGTIQS